MYFLLLALTISAFLFLSLRNQKLGLFFVAALLPTYLIRFSLGPLPVTLLECLILSLTGVAIIRAALTKTWTWSPYWPALIAVTVASTISVFVAPDLRAAAGLWKAYFIEPMLLFLVAVNTLKTKEDWNHLVDAMSVSVACVSVLVWVQHWTGWLVPLAYQTSEGVRATGVYGYPNAVGLFVAPVVALLLGRILVVLGTRYWGDFKQILWYTLVSILGIGALVFAQSEGALVGLAFGLAFVGLLLPQWRKVTVAGVLLAVTLILIITPIRNVAVEKMTFMDTSGRLRLIMWQETRQFLGEHPIVGAGLGGFQTAIKPYHHAFRVFDMYLFPHQLILNVWVELGILGVVVFGCLVAWFFRLIKKAGDSRADYVVLIGGMITLLVHGLVDVPYFKNDLAVLFWLLIAGSSIFVSSQKKV